MEIARGTDLPDLLAFLGYTVTRIGRYYSTKEMDSLRIKNRRTWYRYSERVGGDAITFLQHFCGRSFPEAVEDLLAFHGRARDAPAKKAQDVLKVPEPPPPLCVATQECRYAPCLCLSEKAGHCAPSNPGLYQRWSAV